MANDLNLALGRASRAEGLLNDDLLMESFKVLEDSYIDKWRKTNTLDTGTREKLFIAVRVVEEVRNHLHSVVADGKLAQRQLDDMAKLAEPRKRFGIV